MANYAVTDAVVIVLQRGIGFGLGGVECVLGGIELGLGCLQRDAAITQIGIGAIRKGMEGICVALGGDRVGWAQLNNQADRVLALIIHLQDRGVFQRIKRLMKCLRIRCFWNLRTFVPIHRVNTRLSGQLTFVPFACGAYQVHRLNQRVFVPFAHEDLYLYHANTRLWDQRAFGPVERWLQFGHVGYQIGTFGTHLWDRHAFRPAQREFKCKGYQVKIFDTRLWGQRVFEPSRSWEELGRRVRYSCN